MSILVIPRLNDKSYVQIGDGSSQTLATINAPQNDYANNAFFALVKGELHIFGGLSDGYKVLFCLTLPRQDAPYLVHDFSHLIYPQNKGTPRILTPPLRP